MTPLFVRDPALSRSPATFSVAESTITLAPEEIVMLPDELTPALIVLTPVFENIRVSYDPVVTVWGIEPLYSTVPPANTTPFVAPPNCIVPLFVFIPATDRVNVSMEVIALLLKSLLIVTEPLAVFVPPPQIVRS